MNPDTDGDALQSTLDDLAHLFIDPSRLTILNDSRVGSGGYGEVWLAQLDGSSRVAVKQLRITQPIGIGSRIATRLARELRIWAKVNHPNVLKLVGYYLSQNYDCAQLISPYLENGNVIEYIKETQPSIQARLDFIRGITLGMAYLHGCDPPICHGDLKPANVLVNEVPAAVLCDFGLAKFVDDSGISSGLTTSRSIKGSLRYMSPELSDDEAKHSLESDIWAWACTTFEVLTDVIPYASRRSDRGIMGAVLQGEAPGSMDLLSGFAQRFDISSPSIFVALQTLIPECWSENPQERPSSSRILDSLTPADLGNRDQPPAQVPEGISRAVEEFGRRLPEGWERGLGTVLNQPSPENEQGMTNANRRTNVGGHKRRDRHLNDDANHPAGGGRRGSVVSPINGAAIPPPPGNPANLRTQNILIPSDMVGCIIGKSGSNITEMRRLSGCKISIANTPHDSTGERMITIVGTPEANEKALFLLYNQMESEMERRVGRGEPNRPSHRLTNLTPLSNATPSWW